MNFFLLEFFVNTIVFFLNRFFWIDFFWLTIISDESGDEKPAVNRNAMLASSSDEDDAPAARKNALESSDDEGPTEKKLESSDDEAPTKKKAKLDSGIV